MVRFSDQADWPSGMIKSAFIKAENGEMNLKLSLSTMPFDKLRVVSKAEPLKALSLSKGNSGNEQMQERWDADERR